MDRDTGRSGRFEERRGGESYRPSERFTRSRSRSHTRRARSSRNLSPRPVADTWVPEDSRHPTRLRSRSPTSLRRNSRSPPYRQDRRTRSPLGQGSPRRERPRSPLGSSWRSRSPYRQRSPDTRSSKFTGGLSRARYPSRSPRRSQPSPPISERYRGPSPPRTSTLWERGSYRGSTVRSKSPNRREGYSKYHTETATSRRTISSPKQHSSTHASIRDSTSTSRRSSPHMPPVDRSSVTPAMPRNPSPTSGVPLSNPEMRAGVSMQTKNNSRPPSSPKRDEINVSRNKDTEHLSRQGEETYRVSDSSANRRTESPQPLPGPLPLHERSQYQTKTFILNNSHQSNQLQDNNTLHSAPAGTSASSAVQSRGPSISLLSAPTRPRGASNFNNRDSTWNGSSTPRRGPVGHHTPPTGPRSGYSQTQAPHESHRQPMYRYSSSVSTSHPRTSRVNHLSGLPSFVPGGRSLSSALDLNMERRLAQYEADEEKSLEQAAEKQQLKRLGLQEWDRLGRDGALNALKSELAESHLQKMTDEDGTRVSAAF